MWADASVAAQNGTAERHMRSTISNTGRFARIAAVEMIPMCAVCMSICGDAISFSYHGSVSLPPHSSDVYVEAVTLLRIPHLLSPADTGFYGESFQMLSQTEGTLLEPIDVGPFTDRSHYRFAVPDDAIDTYGLLHLFSSSPSCRGSIPAGHAEGGSRDKDHVVLAFSSCLRFAGKFLLSEHSLEVILDLEGIMLSPGQTG